MEEVKMFLFSRWIATNYLECLNLENGAWYKEQIIYFNNFVYPNYIKNGTVANTEEFLKDISRDRKIKDILKRKST